MVHPSSDTAPAFWRVSSQSTANSDCVEVASGDIVRMRDSKDRRGPVLTFTLTSWHCFVEAIKHDELGVRGDGTH